MNDVLVVIPTYNEINNLGGVVARILSATDRADVLVVDDNSRDGTGRLADELSMSKSGLFGLFGSKEELQAATFETARGTIRTGSSDLGRKHPASLKP